MQIVKISQTQIFSAAFTLEMLMEVATKYCAMTTEQANKAATTELRGANKQINALAYGKLRTIVAKKLHDSTDYGDTFKTGELEVELDCLPDLDIGQAGANKRTSGGKRAASMDLKGAYTVAKRGVKCTPETDPDKAAIWQHVWDCTSFEEYFQKAPKKGVTKTGRVITAASEMRWAVKSGWIVPASK